MADGNKIYSVSEIFKYINVLMAKDIVLSEVRIKGEITGYSAPASGHIYFSPQGKGQGWMGQTQGLYYQMCQVRSQ